LFGGEEPQAIKSRACYDPL